ncbi:MAG TPA: DUF4321 domain-containing protein [bacterium]|nr:DUF4321 domain-containing protein [bacterium]
MAAKNAGMLILFALLGAVLGGYVGELLGLLTGPGFLHDLFTRSFDVGLDTLVLDLKVVVLTFGLKIYINLCSILGMIAGLYYAR